MEKPSPSLPSSCSNVDHANEIWWTKEDEEELFQDNITITPANVPIAFSDQVNFFLGVQPLANIFTTNSSQSVSSKREQQQQQQQQQYVPGGVCCWKQNKDIKPCYCPDAVTALYNMSNSSSSPSEKKVYSIKDLRLRAMKHIVALGWKIEYCNGETLVRLRYCSPQGKYYYSFNKVCSELVSLRTKKAEKQGQQEELVVLDSESKPQQGRSAQVYKDYMDELKKQTGQPNKLSQKPIVSDLR